MNCVSFLMSISSQFHTLYNSDISLNEIISLIKKLLNSSWPGMVPWGIWVLVISGSGNVWLPLTPSYYLVQCLLKINLEK